MTEEERLLGIFDVHKKGKIVISHHPLDKIYTTEVTLGDLFKMFKAVYERDMDCSCHSPLSSIAWCECCKGDNAVGSFRKSGGQTNEHC